jgi:hypothetical protein
MSGAAAVDAQVGVAVPNGFRQGSMIVSGADKAGADPYSGRNACRLAAT